MNDRSPRHENRTVEYEHTDFRLAVIVWFFAGLALALLLTAGLMAGLLWMFVTLRPVTHGQFPNLQELRSQAPLLQPDPSIDLDRMKTENARRLSTYGWVDPSVGIAHIPVEQAMRILVERGLPADSLVPDSPAIPPVKTKPTIPPPLTRRASDESAIQ